jgi:hypothetical protein
MNSATARRIERLEASKASLPPLCVRLPLGEDASGYHSKLEREDPGRKILLIVREIVKPKSLQQVIRS